MPVSACGDEAGRSVEYVLPLLAWLCQGTCSSKCWARKWISNWLTPYSRAASDANSRSPCHSHGPVVFGALAGMRAADRCAGPKSTPHADAPAVQPPAADPATKPSAQTSGFVEVEGGKLHYEVAGSGPVIVLIHDGLLHSEVWDGQWGEFSKDYRVIRYDRRGVWTILCAHGALFQCGRSPSCLGRCGRTAGHTNRLLNRRPTRS